MSLPQLPETLLGRPFAASELRLAGVPASRLRHAGLHRPTRGVRATTRPSSTAARAAAFALALPDDIAFSHTTAAHLLGLPLPPHLESVSVLDVMRDAGRPRIRRSGCRGHRGLASRQVVTVGGLRVVGAADTWCDLGEVLDRGLGRDDLVVIGDAVVERGETTAVLAEMLGRRVRPRGTVLLREALGLVRRGVRSPMESRARLVFHDAGFPEPEVNATVTDRHGGWLLEGDLVWRERRVVGEYQGAVHADRRRRSLDAHRSGLARDEDWTVLEIWAEDVHSAPRRRTMLRRFARELELDVRDLVIA